MVPVLSCLPFFFFFSSRRRHTRSDRDWSFRRVLFRSAFGDELERVIALGGNVQFAIEVEGEILVALAWRDADERGLDAAAGDHRLILEFRNALPIGRGACWGRG